MKLLKIIKLKFNKKTVLKPKTLKVAELKIAKSPEFTTSAKILNLENGLKSKIESLLFASPKPVSIKQISKLDIGSAEKIKESLKDLINEYKEQKRGIQIVEHDSKYQMVSAAENSSLVQKLTKQEISGELSRPSLETLTIIAYRAPISKFDLERIRGINCTLILRNLLMRGLINVKLDPQKKENYYNVSFDFIRYLGINNVFELPDYKKLSKHDSIERALEQE